MPRKPPPLVHAGRITYSKTLPWTLYADASDALAWDPKLEVKSRFWLRKKATAEQPIGDATAVGLQSSTNGDVWLTGKGIVLLDMQPKKAHDLPPDKRALLTERVWTIPAQEPRLAGTLKVTSGCLALLDGKKQPTFTAADVERAVASKQPLALKWALLIPLPKGTYEVLYEMTAKKSNWAPIWYQDELGSYGSRITVTKKPR